MAEQLPDQKILERLQKLANMAAQTTSPEEAAIAAARLQEELTRHNLDLATVENAQAIKDGKREEAKVEGGTYTFQRELWLAVARLNFCLYWSQSYSVFTNAKRVGSGRARYTTAGYVKKRRHALVGRIVNTRATIAMASYLQQAIERLVEERLRERGYETGQAMNSQKFSNWAVSLRKGAFRRVIEKLEDRQNALEAKLAEEARAAAARAERAGISTGTGVTLRDVRMSEYEANVDFTFGDGTSAKWAAQRAENARRRKEEAEARARWAAANPLLAAAEAEKRRKARERAARGSGARDNVDASAFWAGYDLAKDLSLEQQVDGERVAGALR